MRRSITPLMGTPFETGVASLEEARLTWHKGASPGLLSRAAKAFDLAAAEGDVRASAGAAVARALAGDLVGARKRLREHIAKNPEHAGGYVALGLVCLRDPDPLANAEEASWALVAARNLVQGVPCIDRLAAAALSAAGHFMFALQCARSALSLDADDVEAKIWSGLLRLYFGGDITAASTLTEIPAEAEAQLRSPAVWLVAAAGHYARSEFHEARVALRRATAPLKIGNAPEAPLVDASRRWLREARGFGSGVPMSSERWLRDVGGPASDYVRTRSALASLREACARDAERAAADGVSALDVESVMAALEARTRRGMLEWGARLLVRGFAEAYLPLVSYLEGPAPEVLAAMDLVLLDD